MIDEALASVPVSDKSDSRSVSERRVGPPKALAKALHTVTVLVRLARHIETSQPGLDAHGLVVEALKILGYEPGCADKDGCAMKAIKLLEAETDRAADEAYAKEKASEAWMTCERGVG